MELKDKEVYFDLYCKSCKYYKTDESEDPCDECLEYPFQEYSHKPMNYKEADDDVKK